MDRWAGILNVSLAQGGPPLRIAVSLLLSPSSKTLAVPSVNAIFFKGDRVEGTGDPVIEKLSDSRNIAGMLVAKLGGAANAWVVDASTFAGPFAIYKEMIPSVNSRGEPKRYDPTGFPASSSIVAVLTNCVDQIKNVMLRSKTREAATNKHIPTSPLPTSSPKTVILGFSKGGTVVNQLSTELAHFSSKSPRGSTNSRFSSSEDRIIPSSSDNLLFSISEFHYVDVGLNCTGAYLTDRIVTKMIADHLLLSNKTIRFTFHGTPRQWCDLNRPWIQKEKDTMRRLLEDEVQRCEGKLQVSERFYLANQPPTLRMHFEIIEIMDIR
ncbi:uncharacterized protein [Typha angustifolia]|uniref:uncharacterized protein n=1 Tax=Typha angustifolia TaxID=59011 RepID=UPI003C2F9047